MTRYSWQCSVCKTENEKKLSKFEAAFFHSKEVKINRSCKKCGARKVSGAALACPDFDEDLLKEWSKSKSLIFSPEDEDIIMSSADFALLKSAFEWPETLKWKRKVVLSAIAVKLYDERFKGDRERSETISFLKAHIDEWKDEKSVSGYIRKGAYRKI